MSRKTNAAQITSLDDMAQRFVVAWKDSERGVKPYSVPSSNVMIVTDPSLNGGKRKPVHPGAVLRLDFMEPLGLSAIAVAKACGVPRTRIERVAREKTAISADTALRLARLFGTSPRFWLNLQADYDLRLAAKAARKEIARIEQVKKEAAA